MGLESDHAGPGMLPRVSKGLLEPPTRSNKTQTFTSLLAFLILHVTWV